MRFVKKPVEIEAIRWTGTNIEDATSFVDFATLPSDGVHVQPGIGHTPGLGTLDIPTLEGTMTAMPGDWIIRGVKGEFYPCKPDIFRATYTPIGEDEEPGDWCEVCDRPATTADVEGVPFCTEHWESLVHPVTTNSGSGRREWLEAPDGSLHGGVADPDISVSDDAL